MLPYSGGAERGSRTYCREPVELAEVVYTAAKAMQYPLTRQGSALHIDVEEDLPEVEADAIEQAVLNLLANAVEYSGKNRQIDRCLNFWRASGPCRGARRPARRRRKSCDSGMWKSTSGGTKPSRPAGRFEWRVKSTPYFDTWLRVPAKL